jgi:hypothetical protein
LRTGLLPKEAKVSVNYLIQELVVFSGKLGGSGRRSKTRRGSSGLLSVYKQREDAAAGEREAQAKAGRATQPIPAGKFSAVVAPFVHCPDSKRALLTKRK